MASLNRVTLIGNVGKEPEVRYTANGKPVANFSVATNERWTDKEGKKQERTEWHRVVCFSVQAEFVKEYVRKGSLVYVEGRLVTDKWEDKDGGRHETVKVEAVAVQGLDRKTAGASSASSDATSSDDAAA